MLKSTLILFVLLGILFLAPQAAAQTVLFDGRTHEQGRAAALLVPAVITGDDYGLFGRLEYGVTDYFNFFGQLGGEFNGGATALAGLGWAATFYRQTEALPLNIGFFNSYLFPLRRSGPDAFVTVAPVLSHAFERDSGAYVTPYFGAAATFRVGGPGRGNDVNALVGVRISRIADRWDFLMEGQAGQRSQFALGFLYRF